ncbi:MAG: hypothetical protein U9P79_01450 [Candidatus Cloacimonadota bacterium]|nr:hypothetical protein [Candidatus Cloacimonadota bacterium]
MKANLTRNKVSPKSHKKIIAFIHAKKLESHDVESLEHYLENRKDLHYLYLIATESISKKIIAVCNRYNHIKLIHSTDPKAQIVDIKNQYGVDVKFEERDFEELKKRSL